MNLSVASYRAAKISEEKPTILIFPHEYLQQCWWYQVHRAVMQVYLSLYNNKTQERDKQGQNFSWLQQIYLQIWLYCLHGKGISEDLIQQDWSRHWVLPGDSYKKERRWIFSCCLLSHYTAGWQGGISNTLPYRNQPSVMKMLLPESEWALVFFLALEEG